MSYDDMIRAIGDFGPYQRRILFLLCLPLISCGVHGMVGVFLTAQPDFRCLLPHESPGNATYQLPPNITNANYPWDYDTKNWAQCKRYDLDFAYPYNASGQNFSLMTPATMECDSFVYDTTTYERTTTTEFDVVCNNAWLRATTDALFLVGMMLGSVTFGRLSDRYGRKPIFCGSLILQMIAGLLVAVSPEIISYMIFRLIIGSALNGIFLISYVSVIEMVVPERRSMVGTVTQLSYSFGHIITAAFAYFLTNWRILQIAITVPNLVFLVYWWFIPESPRWLVTTGRLKEAKELLHKASFDNGIEFSQDTLDNMLSDCTVINNKKSDHEQVSMFDLFRYPNLRRKSLILFFSWFVNNSIYYGLSWNTSSLSGNAYINFSISGLVEIPAHIFVLLTLNRWGRRHILCDTMLIAGTSLLLRILVSDDMLWLEVVLTMIAKLAISASYAAVYVFSTEQFPTVIRNAGMGACSMCATIGGIVSTYINYSSIIWKPLPIVVFGSSSLIAGLSALLLPETLHAKLPASIQDSEQFGKRSIKLDGRLTELK